MRPAKKHAGVDTESFFETDVEDLAAPKPSRNRLSRACKGETELYLRMPAVPAKTDVLEWWRINQDKFPNVAKMVRQYLGVPALSATVERFFSGAGLAFCDLRQRMAEGTLEALLWAKFIT